MRIIYLSILFIGLLTLGYSACPQNCTNCPTPTSCSACSAGFFLVNQTSCQPCPNGCTDCALGTDGRPNCTACALPSQLGPNGQCFLCNPSCLTCTVNANNCTSCKDGQELRNINSTGTCGAISNCPVQNCGQCSPMDAQNNTYCIRCLFGYFSFKRQCYPCLFSCAACNFNSTELWPNITQFFDRAIRQTFNITTNSPPPGVLPPFMQGLNWLNMTVETQRNWFQAFFVLQVIQPLVINLTIPQIVRMTTQFVISLQNMTVLDQQRAIVVKVNNITGKNFTKQQLDQKEAQIAANMTLCANCTAGFQMTLTPSGFCTNCAPHCVECSSSQCTRCERSYFVQGGICSQCTAPCLTCSGSATTCTSCAPPASLTAAGTCVICLEPCATCSSGSLNICITCNLPYSLTPAAGVCYRCDQDLCTSCNSTNTSICYTCKNGSTLVNGRCQVCPVNCLSCSPGNSTSPSICFQCIRGFVLSITNGTCLPCGPGCIQCSDTSTCLECQVGLFLNSTNGKCQKCRQGCTACTDSQSCSGYQPGVIIINNQTVNCRPGCKICDQTQPQVCTQCQPRYYLSSNICKSCEPGCQKCSSDTICTQCLDNLILQSDSCLKCEGNCRTCNVANLTLCLTCIRGTTLVSGQCIRVCSVGCVDCDPTNSSICIKCDQGHALTANSQCVKCPGSCSGICDARNISICLSCVDGFQLKENKCIRCFPGCAKCLNGQCSQCVPEFTLTQNSTGSYVCQQKCRAPCATCNQDQCLTCEAGFILNGNRCDPDFSCNPNCEFCPRGTQKVANGSCVPCPVNCSSCSNGVCFQCVDGLFLDSNTSNCVFCPPPCRTCYNNHSCDLCAPGFTKQIVSMASGVDDAVYSDKCIPCDSNCKTCIVQPDRCTSCFDGFRPFSFRCAGLFTVAYSYELNINYTTFLENSQSQNFIQTLSNMTGVNSTDNYVDYVREGSTVVGGTISASNQASASTIQSSLGSSVAGYTVLSSSVSINYADSPYTAAKQQQQNTTTNVGLIVGVVVGGVALIGIIILIVYKVKTYKAVSKVQSGDQGSNFEFVHSVDNINNMAQMNGKVVEA